jgi:predicted O-linked N-acetylglucosamine transferase (SPINDLY family)
MTELSPKKSADARPGISLLIVSATRLSEQDFLRESFLARSLALQAVTCALRVKVKFDNREGLPAIYNRAIAHVQPQDIVLFCHDDLALDDPWLVERLDAALGAGPAQFDIVGIAGAVRPIAAHRGWSSGFVQRTEDGHLLFDEGALAGRMRHQIGGKLWQHVYGPSPQAVELLDGVFLAMRGHTLLDSGLRFDERFDFHFYDLDFCRQARMQGLRLGVAPIGVTHGSTGDYASPAWLAALAVYRGKWPLPFGVKDDAVWPEATSSPAPTSVDAVTEPAVTEIAVPEAAALAFNAANAAFREERWQAALEAYSAAAAASPALADAHLGRARCLVKQGQLMAARAAFADLLRLEPTHYSGWLETGHLCRQMGAMDQADAAYRRAIAAEPARYEAWLGLMRTLEMQSNFEEGEACLQQATAAAAAKSPQTLREAWHRAGQYRLEQGDLARALPALRQARHFALQDPDATRGRDEAAEVLIDIGELLLRDNQRERAMELLTEASAATREATLARLSQTAFRFNLWQEAIAILRRNLALHPQSPWAHWNLAHLLAECWQMREAETLLEQAEALATMPKAQILRATVASRLGEADKALAIYQPYHAEHPDDVSIASSIAMCALYSDALSPQEVAHIHRENFAALGKGARSRESFVRMPLVSNGKSDSKPRRLRVGLVTADFHFQHPVNIFMQPVLRELDRSRIELSVYFTGISSDAQTLLAKSRAEHWVEATALNDSQLARRIDEDAIDVLMDLSGHTGHNRMRLFAQRAAPVQMTYLGYPGSTGVPNMDWLLGDAIVNPQGKEDLYSEKVWRLPCTVFCYAPEEDYPTPKFTPAHAKRPLTFGSFNNVPKLTPHTLRLWARILAALPESRLLLKAPSFSDPTAIEAFSARLKAEGIAPQRVEFRGPVGLADMMAEYADVDIALDPVPYNGGTTSLQALWMGAPVVVKAGGHFVSRMGASFMTAAGLTDWVAEDDDAYVAIAVAKGQDRKGLLQLKRTLRERLLSCPAWDVKAHTRAMEAAWLGCIREI